MSKFCLNLVKYAVLRSKSLKNISIGSIDLPFSFILCVKIKALRRCILSFLWLPVILPSCFFLTIAVLTNTSMIIAIKIKMNGANAKIHNAGLNMNFAILLFAAITGSIMLNNPSINAVLDPNANIQNKRKDSAIIHNPQYSYQSFFKYTMLTINDRTTYTNCFLVSEKILSPVGISIYIDMLNKRIPYGKSKVKQSYT